MTTDEEGIDKNIPAYVYSIVQGGIRKNLSDDVIVESVVRSSQRPVLIYMAKRFLAMELVKMRRHVALELEREASVSSFGTICYFRPQGYHKSCGKPSAPGKRYCEEHQTVAQNNLRISQEREAARRARYRRTAWLTSMGYSSEQEYLEAKEQRRRLDEAALAELRQAMAALSFTRTFLNTLIPLPNGRKVSWGAATVEDHELRIEMMGKMADGIEADIDRHTEIIKLLIAMSASCLNDLTKVAPTVIGGEVRRG